MDKTHVSEASSLVVCIRLVHTWARDREPERRINASDDGAIGALARYPQRALRKGDADELILPRHLAHIEGDDSSGILPKVVRDCGNILELCFLP